MERNDEITLLRTVDGCFPLTYQINFPALSKKPDYIGFGLHFSEAEGLRFRLHPTTDGMSFGPVIPGEREMHVTAFAKAGVFNSHLTWIDESGHRKYSNIATLKQEEIVNHLRNAGADSLSQVFDRYSENDEALVMTDEGQRIFGEALSGSLSITAKGRKLHFDCRIGRVIEYLRPFGNRMESLFKVGSVAEALDRNLLGERFVCTPDLRQIVWFDGLPYVLRRRPDDVIAILHASSEKSVEQMFHTFEKTEYRPIIKYAELLGIKRLMIELERRGLLLKWLSI